MELRDLLEVVWGDGYEPYYVDDDATDPVFVGHFGYDDNKSETYLDRTVVGVECAGGKLEATVRNPQAESCGSQRRTLPQ